MENVTALKTTTEETGGGAGEKAFGPARRAVALLSGGLDSTLAVKLMLEQGIEVFAMNFTSAFCTCNSGGHGKGGCRSEGRRVAEEFGIPIKVVAKGPDYMEVVRNPRYGYGKGINPCVDCRIYMFIRARRYMEEIGASFIITGEVLGQRPMSQRRDAFRVIERESGLAGLILRPLSAMHLEPTVPEKAGIVDRSRLLSVAGRCRRPQMDLAEELEINDYPCPSGGCLLTDKIFSRKVRDLLDHNAGPTTNDLLKLKAGRHFRYRGVKIVVGRDEEDNLKLKNLVRPGETFIEPAGFPGPVAIVEGGGGEAVAFAASLVLRYSSGKAGGRAVVRATLGESVEELDVQAPAPEEAVEEARIC
jgi:hypothetical protein